MQNDRKIADGRLFVVGGRSHNLNRHLGQAMVGGGRTLKRRPQQAGIGRLVRRKATVRMGLRNSCVEARRQQQDGQHNQPRPRAQFFTLR